MSRAGDNARRLSALYYNRGLDLARIRDLSGAYDMLRISIQFNKNNISARNLLGLVCYETGETVEALQEWVISSNIQQTGNAASRYIEDVRRSRGYLQQSDQMIKAYNGALSECREGNDDVAAITLRRITSRNPKYIKADLLMALVDIHEGHYSHARKILRRAIKIDRHNPLILRYLQEVDERLGTATTFEMKVNDISRNRDKPRDPYGDMEKESSGTDVRVERTRPSYVSVISLVAGLFIGVLAAWFVVAPSVRSSLNRSANEKIVDYTTTMATQENQIQDLQDQINKSADTVTEAEQQRQDSQARVDSYDSLIDAYSNYQNGDYEKAGDALAKVDVSLLSASAGEIYNSVKDSINTAAYGAYVNSGDEAFYLKNWSEAAAQFEKALAITSGDYDTMNLLAQAYQNLGDTEKAIEAYQNIADTFAGTRRADYAEAAIIQLGGTVSSESGGTSGTDASGEESSGTDTSGNG